MASLIRDVERTWSIDTLKTYHVPCSTFFAGRRIALLHHIHRTRLRPPRKLALDVVGAQAWFCGLSHNTTPSSPHGVSYTRRVGRTWRIDTFIVTYHVQRPPFRPSVRPSDTKAFNCHRYRPTTTTQPILLHSYFGCLLSGTVSPEVSPSAPSAGWWGFDTWVCRLRGVVYRIGDEDACTLGECGGRRWEGLFLLPRYPE
ncbi:hypothetical protein BDQ17DRAFT_276951 [Cyathus striatus]|nr:hypothetical protein BDQ17DRAFT_906024 [Cyathus striatus]KAF8991591.1 hypothetical protein BDQ17DRAFT_276951 [Cyathus striatus]